MEKIPFEDICPSPVFHVPGSNRFPINYLVEAHGPYYTFDNPHARTSSCLRDIT